MLSIHLFNSDLVVTNIAHQEQTVTAIRQSGFNKTLSQRPHLYHQKALNISMAENAKGLSPHMTTMFCWHYTSECSTDSYMFCQTIVPLLQVGTEVLNKNQMVYIKSSICLGAEMSS